MDDADTTKDARTALKDALGQLAEVHQEVHQNVDADKFAVGWVDAVSDRHVRLCSIDAAGREDGVEIRRLDNVERVVTDGVYLTRRLRPLMECWTRPIWPRQRLTGHMEDLVMDALTVSVEDGIVVTLFMSDTSQYTGPVVKLSDEAGTIADLDYYGAVEKEVAFRVSDIDALDLGTEHERIVQILGKRRTEG